MARGRALKQSYFGRVISPAKYFPNNGKPFIAFSILVDNLAVDADKKRVSGKIQCSYAVVADNDPVPTILCRILNEDDPDVGGLAGQQYKSVEVLVQGDEKLTHVLDSEGEAIPNAYYKNLEYCMVQVTDNVILELYRRHIESEGELQEDDGVQRPTRAPARNNFRKSTNKAAAARPKAKPRPKYNVGDRLVHSGVEYEFMGGDENVLENWREVVQEEEEVEQDDNPFVRASKKTAAAPRRPATRGSISEKMNSLDSIAGILDDSDELAI